MLNNKYALIWLRPHPLLGLVSPTRSHEWLPPQLTEMTLASFLGFSYASHLLSLAH